MIPPSIFYIFVEVHIIALVYSVFDLFPYRMAKDYYSAIPKDLSSHASHMQTIVPWLTFSKYAQSDFLGLKQVGAVKVLFECHY